MDLQTIKNNYAIEQGYEDWVNYVYSVNTNQAGFQQVMEEICIRAQKAALEKAAESFDMNWQKLFVTNEQNLIR